MRWQRHTQKLSLQGGRYTRIPEFQGFAAFPCCPSALPRTALKRENPQAPLPLWVPVCLDPEPDPGMAQIITSRHIPRPRGSWPGKASPPENKAQPVWAQTAPDEAVQSVWDPTKMCVWAPQTPGDPPKPRSRAGLYRNPAESRQS